VISDSLFEKIVREVLRRLQEKVEQPKRALVLFTGGLIGLPQALDQLKKSQAEGWELVPVLSPAAEEVIGIARIKESLGTAEVFTSKNSPPPSQLLQGVEVVLVPVLTMNTAAKVALGLADTNVTTLISEAIMLGKSIIAARNAADPNSPQRRELGMNKGPAPWVQMLAEYLGRLENFGIRLVDVEELTADICGRRGSKVVLAAVGAQPEETKKAAGVVTRADVIRAWEEGRDLVLRPRTIVTPLAREVAREYGVELVPED